MRIIIETIPHQKQRYDTVGDWTFKEAFEEGDLKIYVSSLNNWKYEALVGIHEAIEAILCAARSISEDDVTNHDTSFTGKGEPGNSPKAPYRKEHIFSTKIEKMIAKELKVNWRKYDIALKSLPDWIYN